MFYEPVQSERYFEKTRRYSEIDWNSFADVVDAFERRIRSWYIEPIEVLLEKGLDDKVRKEVRSLAGRDEGGHYSFAVMALTCLLIDTLSQFVKGVPESSQSDFKEFVRDHFPDYRSALSPSIHGYRPPQRGSTAPRHDELIDVADVLYQGFRCGILHQAHAPLYCGIVPGDQPPTVEATNHAKYASGATRSTPGGDCPVVVISPEHLFGQVVTFFADYLRNLKDKDPRYDQLRTRFKSKFSDSFGIDLSASSLR